MRPALMARNTVERLTPAAAAALMRLVHGQKSSAAEQRGVDEGLTGSTAGHRLAIWFSDAHWGAAGVSTLPDRLRP